MDMVIKEIKKDALAEGIPIMLDDGIEFLCNFIKEHDCKKILEIGAAVGYSAIMMADVDEKIDITTIERDEKRYLKALENIKKADKEKQIKLIYNDALNINIGDEEFDLIFIDAAKAQNIKFFQRFGLYLKSHGFIITDNLNFHGLVDKDLEEIESKNVRGIVRKIREFKEFLLENNDYETVFYDVGDGISISEKIKE